MWETLDLGGSTETPHHLLHVIHGQNLAAQIKRECPTGLKHAFGVFGNWLVRID